MELDEMEENLQCLTMGIQDISIDDLPRHYQCKNTRVSGHFGRLVHRVARAVMCFHENYHEDYPIVDPIFFVLYLY